MAMVNSGLKGLINTPRLNNVVLMFANRLQRRPNVKPALFRRIVFTGLLYSSSWNRPHSAAEIN